MTRLSVKSSNIKAVGYDPKSKTLEVEFNSGSTYQYFEVPASIYNDFMDASSLGSFFAESIKNKFNYEKVS